MDLFKQIKELPQDPKKVSPEQVEALMATSLEFFDQIKEKVQTGTGEEKQAAQQILTDLKKALEEQASNLCKSMGIDPVQFLHNPELPDHLDPEELELVRSAQQEVDQRKRQTQESPRAVKRAQKLIFS